MNNLLKRVPALLLLFIIASASAQDTVIVDTRIDNMRYWNKLIADKIIDGNPEVEIPPAIYTGSYLFAKGITSEDSPDVVLNDTISMTENSVFIDPNDNNTVGTSANSLNLNSNSFIGTNFIITDNNGESWGGAAGGTSGPSGNGGDPAVIIDMNSRKGIGYIDKYGGQSIDLSDNAEDWESIEVGENTGIILDKNHLWVDYSPVSKYQGNMYNAWTWYGGDFDSEIGISRSVDGGMIWTEPYEISSEVDAGIVNQGVNIQTGPMGEVYAVWAIYDFWDYNLNGIEEALGFAKSNDGGQTFEPANRIIEDIKGIRQGITKNMRVNSFPVMAVDITGRSSNGNIYVAWANYGLPGTNEGTNVSIYFIKSIDNGSTWSEPTRVNQGPFEDGKEAYIPWMTCDPETGTISIIYYDDRNVSDTEVETYVSISYDAGLTWEDMKISDVAFTPSPVPGTAPGYMGDYLGIAARGGKVYPIWPDNRSGMHLSYVSPFETLNPEKPSNLQVNVNDDSGVASLSWEFPNEIAIEHFIVYRDGNQIGTTINSIYDDNLPEFGNYIYSVSAKYDTIESAVIRQNAHWGSSVATATPELLEITLDSNETAELPLNLSNTGQLDLIYNISTAIDPGTPVQSPIVYCSADGGGGEHISRVIFGDIDNPSGSDGYADYTEKVASVNIGNIYDITIENGSQVSTDDLGIWIDWNQDGDFDDESENVVCESANFGMGTYPITVPIDAFGGPTTMRVRIKFSGTDCGDPCGSTNFGEVEDYSINVNAWFSLNNEAVVDTILPGNDKNFIASFDTDGLSAGEYTANIIITSNEYENPELIVPVKLTVTGTVGIAEIEKTIDVSVYPNPGIGAFMLQGYSPKKQNLEIGIYNRLGVMVYQHNENVSGKFYIPFDLSSYSDGFYMINITGNGVSGATKVVLQR